VSHPTHPPLGVLLAGVPGDRVAEVAHTAEHLGFGSLWAPEDYPERPASVVSALAISATTHITVATGVTSLATRHPVVVAMEAATLAEAAPGRTAVGVGLGLPGTLRSLGCMPPSPLTLVRERAAAVRDLLAGDTVDLDDPAARLDGVRLAHPPAAAPPLVLGGLGPRMLALAGQIADGVIISSLGTEAYLRDAIERITTAAALAGRARPRITAFAWFHLTDDDAAGRDVLRPNVAGALGFVGPGPLTDSDGWSAHLAELIAGEAPLIETIPDRWVDEMVIAGAPATCAEGIARRLHAGADEVVLCPMGDDPVQQLHRAAALLPGRL
jgi:5,10-methylenetetrahydromethanopterin reductase